MGLLDDLKKYANSDYIPFHMPGHKRRNTNIDMEDPYLIDITEIDGFDNLGKPEGILKECQKDAANLYGSIESLFLVNGSTVGILAAISAHCKPGDKILMARNCHKAVYNAVYLRGLVPIYLQPPVIMPYGICGSIGANMVSDKLNEHRDIKLVVITSPTYEGIISDIKQIVSVSHKHKVPLLVDEAHGAHLGFHKGFYEGSVKAGADIVIHSLHKVLPAMTQTGLLHINSKLANLDQIKKFLNIYQTSSPSYVLMASIHKCIELLREDADNLFKIYYNRLINLRNKLGNLQNMEILGEKMISSQVYAVDPSKIVISVVGNGITGTELYHQLLEAYHIQLEMSNQYIALAMTSIYDIDTFYDQLIRALFLEDVSLKKIAYSADSNDIVHMPESVYIPSEVDYQSLKRVKFTESQEYICAEAIIPYPPGIPIIIPGEKITQEIIDMIQEYNTLGVSITGMEDPDLEFILVCDEV